MLYFIISFVITLILTPIVKHVAHQKGWIAKPTQDRWHKKATAHMGGIAMYIAVAIPLLMICEFSSFFKIFDASTVYEPIALISLIGITFMFFSGLFDDFKNLRPNAKLITQILAASMIAFAGHRLNWSNSLTIDTVMTIIWIVGITNAFNLLDNMDGLCSGAALLASLTLAFLFQNINIEACNIALMIAGTTCAFLIFNSNPASIFMGDCGSQMLGFALSSLFLQYSTSSGGFIRNYLIPILIFIVPIVDTTMVTIVRILSGRKAYIGGKDHTSHRLVLLGFSERKAVVGLYGIGFTSGVAAIFAHMNDSFTSPVLIVPVFLAVMLMSIYLAQVRVYPEKEFCMLTERRFSPFLMELAIKHQVLNVILDFGLMAFSYYLAYRLRFPDEFAYYFKMFLKSLPAVIACKVIALWYVGVYQSLWRSMGINDMFNCIKGSLLGTILSISLITFVFRFQSFSKGVFIFDFIMTTSLLIIIRGSFWLFNEKLERSHKRNFNPVLLYGAGRRGEILLKELLENNSLDIKPDCFIDDDPLLVGKKLHSYPILGTSNDLQNVCTSRSISGVIIAFHDAVPIPQTVKDYCKTNGLFLKRFVVSLEDC